MIKVGNLIMNLAHVTNFDDMGTRIGVDIIGHMDTIEIVGKEAEALRWYLGNQAMVTDVMDLYEKHLQDETEAPAIARQQAIEKNIRFLMGRAPTPDGWSTRSGMSIYATDYATEQNGEATLEGFIEYLKAKKKA